MGGGLITAVVVTIAVYGLYLTIALLARTVEKEDIGLIEAIEAKFGVNFGPIKRLLFRFVS